jgi:hypothetical protein
MDAVGIQGLAAAGVVMAGVPANSKALCVQCSLFCLLTFNFLAGVSLLLVLAAYLSVSDLKGRVRGILDDEGGI